VDVRSIRCCAVAAALTAGALSGCAKNDSDSAGWFAKPVDMFGRNAGYSFSDLQETRQDRPITASDLVDANGACPAPAAPPQARLDNSNNAAPVAPDTSSLLGGGVGLGMSECDVVFRAGQPSSVELGKNPNGDRTAVLTFRDGPRPGVYRFQRGRLMEMDRVEVPTAPQPANKKPAKKPPKKNDQA
jgi:hypothetical protein